VAIDWESLGPGPAGAEIATLVFRSARQVRLPGADLSEVDASVFDAYLAGLRDAGADVPAPVARLGYAAAVSLRWSLPVALLRALADPAARARTERGWGRPWDAIVEAWVPLTAFLLDRADEARALGGIA